MKLLITTSAVRIDLIVISNQESLYGIKLLTGVNDHVFVLVTSPKLTLSGLTFSCWLDHQTFTMNASLQTKFHFKMHLFWVEPVNVGSINDLYLKDQKSANFSILFHVH